MPKSRKSRSSSPQKNPSLENSVDVARRKTLQNVKDIFFDTVDEDIIEEVLKQCDWKDDEAVEKLLLIAASEEQKKTTNSLQTIAAELLGPLRTDDYNAPSQLSPSQKVIQRPQKSSADNSRTASPVVYAPEQYMARGGASLLQTSSAQNTLTMDDDEHFPCLTSTVGRADGGSSIGSQRLHSDRKLQAAPNKGALLSQAQNAYQQQYDDAEGAQRWEKCKQKLSVHYLETFSKQAGKMEERNDTKVPISKPVFADRPVFSQAGKSENGMQTSRKFPVRLLSSDPDDSAANNPEVVDFLANILESQKESVPGKDRIERQSSTELNETVLKCIYEVQNDLLDEHEFSIKSRNLENVHVKTEESKVNQPMTLPTVGLLSADAAEFVPRPKPASSPTANQGEEISGDKNTDDFSNVMGPTSKRLLSNVNDVDKKDSVRNPALGCSEPHPVNPPLAISPSLSPGMSPPLSQVSPAAKLTGSPMFITPKWRGRPPVAQINTQARFVTGPPPVPHTALGQAAHLGYRFPVPYPSHVVFTAAPQQRPFHVAGIPAHYAHPQSISTKDRIEDRAAIATGQPIMATAESTIHAPPNVTKKLTPSSMELKVEKILQLQKNGFKVLVIVRGLPGSGKSTLARNLQLQTGIVLSTDDYFMKCAVYDHNSDKLPDAHKWNRDRAKEAMKKGQSPVVIDNTNTQKWEFSPYVNIANNFNYHVELMEPDTPWKFKPAECAKRTLHGVPLVHIQRMLERYEHNITIEALASTRKGQTRTREEIVEVSSSEVPTVPCKENTEYIMLKDGSATDTDGGTKMLTDMDRIQNLYRGEDLRMLKQKSAESDSDSISTETLSLHSESWSNTSSRTASPKPLRPSLMTPGALHKMEKARVKQLTFQPVVQKVSLKSVIQIEESLSTESVMVVNDLMNEHATNKVLSNEDVTKLEEELKALLSITLSNMSEIKSAEELIGLKLRSLIHGSFEESEELLKDDNSSVSDSTSVSQRCLDLTADVSENKCTELSLSYTPDGNDENEAQPSVCIRDTPDEVQHSTSTVHEEQVTIQPQKESSGVNNPTSRPLASWKDIAKPLSLNEPVSVNVTDVNYVFSAVWKDDSVANGTGSPDFETRYWDKASINHSNSTTNPNPESWTNENGDWAYYHRKELVDSCNSAYASENLEVIENTWDQFAKPQRKRKQKNSVTCQPSNVNSPVHVSSCRNHGQTIAQGIISEDLKHQLDSSPESSDGICGADTDSSKCIDEQTYTAETADLTDGATEHEIHIDNVENCAKENALTRDDKLESINQCVNENCLPDSLKVIMIAYQESAPNGIKHQSTSNGEGGFNISDKESEQGSDQNCVTKEIEDKKMPNTISTTKAKKRVKRRSAKPAPFLALQDKEKFISSEWKTLPITSQDFKSESEKAERNNKERKHAGIMTEMDMFKTVELLNSGGFIDSKTKYLTGKSVKVNGFDKTDFQVDRSKQSETIGVSSFHQSTSTDDLSDFINSDNVEFLQTCFPDVPIADLECVLHTCAGNVEWAINLIVDWDYSLDLTEEEKQRFTDGMIRVQRCVNPELVETSLPRKTSPAKLLDMCFSLVENELHTSREDLEQQMIQTAKERLNRIETDSMTKMRYRRSTSLSESTASGLDLTHSSYGDISLMRSFSSPDSTFLAPFSENIIKKLINNDTHVSGEHKGSQIDYRVFSYESPSEGSGSDNGKSSLVPVDTKDGKQEDTSLNEDDLNQAPDRDVCDAGRSRSPVRLELDRVVIEQLEAMFCNIDCRPDVSRVDVQVPWNTAYQLYVSIQQSLFGQAETTRRQQLIQDEELAKRLQQEEQATKSPRRSSDRVDLPSTRPQRPDRPTPVVGLSVKGSRAQNEMMSRKPTPVQSLNDIMNEEQQIQQQEQNFEQLVRMEGGETMLANRLKLKKLVKFFPDIDRDFLENVFKVHCFNLSETIESIKHSRGEHVPLQSSLPMDWESEQQLIEHTKQQSMQQMLDAYIYHPVVSKDYQDGAAPGYEDYRGEATLHHRLRHECFQKAQEAHRRGLKQVAAFYSQQGHQHTRKIKEANVRASEQILAERKEILEEHNTLDLHGLHIEEALAALERIISQKQSERRKHLMVITGRGAHSRGGVARLRPAVIQYLQKQQYSYREEQTGVLKVSLKNVS